MSTTLEPSTETRQNETTQSREDVVDRVRTTFTACRVKFKWLGTSKTLSSDQKSRVAESFDADGDSISAMKKLIDTKHEAYKSLTAIKSAVTKYWKDNSMPYPESGIRLLRREQVEAFDETLQGFRRELEFAVAELGSHFDQLKASARDRLGSLYCETDYPSSLDGCFELGWEFPSVDPPNYLQQLNPEVYAEQSRRVAERFDHAVELAEQAFLEELDRLVSHLSQRLANKEDGQPQVFRDSAVTNLREFFERFRQLNVGSNDQLDQLVSRCEGLMQGVNPQGLRDNSSLRRSLSTRLSTVQSSLDQLMVDRPRRNIQRAVRGQSDSEASNTRDALDSGGSEAE